MNEEFRSILLEDFPIEWPGFLVRRIALNQHMPRVEKFSEHQHEVHQALLYLRGYGRQHLGNEVIPVQRGSLVVIPEGVRHRFEKSGHRRPVCLAIDFESNERTTWNNSARMRPGNLTLIEARLVQLNEEESKRDSSSIRVASLILQILETVEETAIETNPPHRSGPATAAVRRTIRKEGFDGLSPGRIAEILDRSLDHLNRQFRSECGMTVGEFLSRARLDHCCELLRESRLPMSDVASAVGIYDQNYFSRWFRQRTGQTPTGWRSAMKASTAH